MNPGSGTTLEPLQRSVTIHDLLTHTAGLSYGFTDARVDALYRQADLWRRDQPLEAFIDKITRLPLVQQPGAGWRYSVAYDVLGYLVQVISGQPFAEFLQERVFEPAGHGGYRLLCAPGQAAAPGGPLRS